MHGFLKQSTASQSRLVGPFVDDTDFKSVETGLTIANTDVKLNKNGAAGVNKNSGGGTHRNNGMYSLTFDATDSDTVGELKGSILISGALVVVFSFTTLEESVYDNFFADSAVGPLTAAQVNAEVVDTLVTDTHAEPSSVPSATASIVAKLGWNTALARNKGTQTDSLKTLRNDADSADIATAAITDPDDITFTRFKWI